MCHSYLLLSKSISKNILLKPCSLQMLRFCHSESNERRSNPYFGVNYVYNLDLYRSKTTFASVGGELRDCFWVGLSDP